MALHLASTSKFPRIALAALTLVAFVAFAEWAVGRWLQSPSTAVMTHTFGLVQAPGARVVHSSEGWSINVCNSQGFFDDGLREPRPASRVLLLGDSFAEGLQIGRASAFPNVAERQLEDTEIINAAQSGGFPALYAAYARNFVEAFHPDLLVIQLDDADVDEIVSPSRLREVREELNGHPLIPYEDSASTAGAREQLRRALKRSALLKFLYVRLQSIQQFEQQRFARKFAPRSAHGAAAIDPPPGAAAAFDSLMRQVLAAEPRVLLLYTPHIDYFGAAPRLAFPQRRAFYRDAARRLGIPLADPSDAMLAEYLRSRQPLHGFQNSIMGSGHPNARGHRVIGHTLAEAIEACRP